MKDIDSRRMTWIISVVSAIALSSFMYLIVVFFRLDWVRYDTVERYWDVEVMKCVDEPVKPVILLSRHQGASPEIPLYFDRSLYRHLQKQNSDIVMVNRKKVGYLREWDYGIIVPLSIEGKHVSRASLMPREYLSDCSFSVDDKLLTKLITTRRKMR